LKSMLIHVDIPEAYHMGVQSNPVLEHLSAQISRSTAPSLSLHCHLNCTCNSLISSNASKSQEEDIITFTAATCLHSHATSIIYVFTCSSPTHHLQPVQQPRPTNQAMPTFTAVTVPLLSTVTTVKVGIARLTSRGYWASWKMTSFLPPSSILSMLSLSHSYPNLSAISSRVNVPTTALDANANHVFSATFLRRRFSRASSSLPSS